MHGFSRTCEQRALYNALNFNFGVFNVTDGGQVKNSTVTVPTINSYALSLVSHPRLEHLRRQRIHGQGPGEQLLRFAGARALEFAPQQTEGSSPTAHSPTTGRPGMRSAVRDVIDGTSNTIGFGEWKLGTGVLAKYSSRTSSSWGPSPRGPRGTMGP